MRETAENQSKLVTGAKDDKVTVRIEETSKFMPLIRFVNVQSVQSPLERPIISREFRYRHVFGSWCTIPWTRQTTQVVD